MAGQILFSDGYKYQLRQTYTVETGIIPDEPISTDFIDMDADGRLTIRAGYAWDGPSGPTVDTANFMRGSLVHDALYQLMRERHLDRDECRELADRLLRDICIEDGMSSVRAYFVYRGVRRFGEGCASPSAERPPLAAP